MRLRSFGLAVLATGLVSTACFADALNIGDKAPALTVSKWVKGDKIDKLEDGQIYVVEFWATWCGPCRTSIPHLTELQKKYKGVSFIGVSIWESDTKLVEPFVKEMGDKMDYRVAMDVVPENSKNGQDGKMAKAWMAAAEENGIPSSFIVGKDGKVAWIGHPMSIDKPLEEVVAGKFDVAAAASKRAEAKVAQKKMTEFGRKLSGLLRDRDGNRKEILELVDKAIAETPSMEMNLASLKYDALLRGADADAASAYGAKLVDVVFKENAMGLNMIAWGIVDPEAKIEKSKRDYKLALRAAARANELTKEENYAILDTLALALFETGDPAKAAELQEKAVKLAPQKDAGMSERLEMFRKAAAEKK